MNVILRKFLLQLLYHLSASNQIIENIDFLNEFNDVELRSFDHDLQERGDMTGE